jgi:hypothetical protein
MYETHIANPLLQRRYLRPGVFYSFHLTYGALGSTGFLSTTTNTTTTASSSPGFHPTWTQLPYHQAPPAATNLPTYYSIPTTFTIHTLTLTTSFDFTPTLLHPTLPQTRCAAPRLHRIFPLSLLFFFFASVLLFTVHALA